MCTQIYKNMHEYMLNMDQDGIKPNAARYMSTPGTNK